MNRDILIITSYYPPEIGAASNRIFHLANGLQKHGFEVSVLTPLPNYPTGKIFEAYRGKFKQRSTENNINVHRLWIYASNSKHKLFRLFAMISYSLSLLWFFIWHKLPKTVIIQSPPLLVAFTCMLCIKSKGRNLILNVSDLWPIAGLELGAFKKNFSYKLLEKIERFNYKRANLVLGQSDEILTHVKSIFSDKSTFLYRNFPDFIAPTITKHATEGRLKIVYAGLLGIAQGIYKLCQELDCPDTELHIYGSGAEQIKIEQFIKEHPELPIFYHGHVSRQELHSQLLHYNIAIIPLLNRIYGSVPSKIFEYASLGLPMVYFGGGEGEGIINRLNLGWVAKAGDYKDLNHVLSTIDGVELSEVRRKKIQNTALVQFDFNKQLIDLIALL
ncbi:Glycosyltransferase involved in cell wall bisynthesis [Formosa sp. Hel1_31_208]|uniref:glycosyltransferase family 4 protein n=1 Tax=Formosa sp. Hel1_31_208 TaxID=1798225 RepID=UPI00087D9023|nr:glycosyltransferase family 4 protein [Formosa sp. Hel1_31_208]SDR75622.1 Glycosyltransferase involved in cell wall bisynthesis [Formosa sp. Hel1_31_208]